MVKWLSPWHPANMQQNENHNILTPTTFITSSPVLSFWIYDYDHSSYKLLLKNKHVPKILLSKNAKVQKQVKSWEIFILCTTDKGNYFRKNKTAQKKNRQK